VGRRKFAFGASPRISWRNFDVAAVSLRPSMGHGPGQAPMKIVPYLMDTSIRAAAPKLSPGSKRVDWVFIDDFVEAFLLAATCPLPENRTIDLGSGQLNSVREVAELIYELSPYSPMPLFGALPDRVGDEKVREADPTMARAALGWHVQVSLREGHRGTLEDARAKLKLS